MKNKRMLIRLFFSYVMLVIPMIAVNYLVTNHVITSMRKQVDERMEWECAGIKTELEEYLVSYRNKATMMFSSDKLKKDKMISQKYSTKEGMEYLGNIQMMDRLLESLMLLYDDAAYTMKGYSKLETYLGRTLNCAPEVVELGTVFLDQEESELLLLRSKTQDYLLFHFQVGRAKKDGASVNYLIDMEELYDVLFDGLLEQMTIGIQLTFQNAYQNEQIYLEGNMTDGIRSIEQADFEVLSEESYWIEKKIDSELLGIQLIISYDSRELYRQVDFFKTINAVLMCVFMLLSMLFSYQISKNHYQKIYQLKESLTRVLVQNRVLDSGNGKNDFDTMQMMVESIRAETDRMKHEAADARERMRQQAAMLLFYGGVTEESSVEGLLESCRLELQEAFFTIACIEAEEKEELLLDLEKNLLQDHLLCWANVEDRKVLIVLFELPNEDLLKKHRNQIAERMMCSDNAEEIRIAFSQVYVKFLNAPKAYLEAIGICRTLFHQKQQRIGYLELMNSETEPKQELELSELERLEDDLLRGKWQHARNRLEVVLDYIEKKECSEEHKKYLRYCVMQSMTLGIKNLDEEKMAELAVQLEEWNVECAEEFEQKSRKILEIAGGVTEKQNQKIDFSEILKYINLNYHRYDLSLEEVASHAGISRVYLSKIFKEKTGSKYIDYLTNCRMEQAKKLLEESDLSIKAIGTMVGYYNIPGFRNKFKEYYGINASEYRKQYQENTEK